MPVNAPPIFALSKIDRNIIMENLTLESLPKAFSHLTNEVMEIKRLLLEKSNERPADTDCWFDLNELCKYRPDKPSKDTVYREVSNGIFPVHKRGKKLMFLQSDVDLWIKQGRKRTFAETALDAEQFLKNKKAQKASNMNKVN